MVFYTVFIAIWAALGVHLAYGWPYFGGLLAAALIALWHYRLIANRSREGCFRAFRLNHWIGFVVFAGVAANSALGLSQAH
jgi:4-hydroxybenzoate polyprenyltransferase